MERIRRHLSYANVAATLALVLAMSGGAVAATGGFTAASTSIKACAGSGGVLKLQTGKKCKKGQKSVSWNQQGVPGAKGIAGATGPSGIAGLNGAAVPNATNATTATTATTAQTANNALALGGIPASEFTQRGCASDTGQVRGFAQIPGTVSKEFTPIAPSYNCSGGEVEARKSALGGYKFRFVDNPAEVALATVITPAEEDDYTAHVTRSSSTEWSVTVTRKGSFFDQGVSIVLF
jgi:hypothetical protein